MTPRPTVVQLQPRGLRRRNAAAYLDISVATFDDMVRTGELPDGKRPNGRRIRLWDRYRLDEYLDSLDERNPLDGSGGSHA